MKPENEPSATKIALINNNVAYIQKDISEIKNSIKELSGVYATQISLNELKTEINTIKEASNLWKWLSPTLAAVAAVIIEFLFVNYLQHLK